MKKYPTMEKEKLKLIVKNLELLIDSLKKELDLEEEPKFNYEEVAPYIDDYDEIFYDDED